MDIFAFQQIQKLYFEMKTNLRKSLFSNENKFANQNRQDQMQRFI